jgi:hypothetical protein
MIDYGRSRSVTFLATLSASLIDHVMVNDLRKRINITHMPFRNLDHELIFVEVYHTKNLTAKTPLMKISKTNVELIKQHLFDNEIVLNCVNFKTRPQKGVSLWFFFSIERSTLPAARNLYRYDYFCFQQDLTPFHTVQKWCEENLPDFIPKDEWPPISPDLNPLDFSI